MTLAEIIRAQLATGRPLRVTLALLEALAEPPAVLADDPLYSSWTALCRALALPASTPGPAIVAAVVAIRETAKHDREERDEARATMLAMRKQRDDYADRLDAAQSRADERDVMRRERDEARVEVERLRAERDEASESLRLSVAAWDATGMQGRDAVSVIREAEERGARWMHAAAVECSRYIGADHAMPKLNVQRICEAARKAGEHE